MAEVSKHTYSPDANNDAPNWLDTRAVIGWLMFEDADDDMVTVIEERIEITEAGQAAADQAQAEDAELDRIADLRNMFDKRGDD